MRIAHLILCHANAGQVRRLVDALQFPGAGIYIHVDKRVPLEPFLPLASIPGVQFISNRVKVYWGGYSIIEATLSGLRQVLSSGIQYDYINLLSGQDYPLRPQAALHEFLEAHRGKLFMNLFPDWDDSDEHQHRLKQYYFAGARIRGKYTVERLARRLRPRKFPEGFVPIGRSQWFTIPAAAAAYTLRFLEQNKKIARLFRYMWAPDELLFQSVLYNSPYRSAITNDNLRYADWSEQQPSPKLLTMADAASLERSNCFFARKFDVNTDTAILDYLDRHIAKQM